MPKRKGDSTSPGVPNSPHRHLTKEDGEHAVRAMNTEEKRALLDRLMNPEQIRQSRQLRAVLRAKLGGRSQTLASALDQFLFHTSQLVDHYEQEESINPHIEHAKRSGVFAKERRELEIAWQESWQKLLQSVK